MTASPIITLDRITVRLGDQWLLKGLSWQINAGENWVVWGPNGAGKTTLAKALMDQAAVVQGRIHRHYLDPPGDTARSHPIAWVSSEHHHHLYLKEQFLEEMGHFSGNPDPATTAGQVLNTTTTGGQHLRRAVIRRMGIAPVLDKPLKALSAGEMRKLLIARALTAAPRLLILDEPFNGLDQGAQAQLRDMMNQLAGSGTQLVLITHRPKEISSVFTHLLHLDEGVAKWHGPVRDFFEQTSRRTEYEVKSGVPYRNRAVASTPAPSDAPVGSLIEMRDVSVTYGDHKVLSNVDWTVMPGENWALIGPNGAGKSTLLKLITGDNLQGYANKLTLFGRPKGSGESIWDIKQKIGYVAEDLQLRYQRKISGLDVVRSGFFDSVGLYRHCSESQRETADIWIRKTGIADLTSQTFSKLSYGQQRMVLIVRAMVKTPRLLILDEPCNGLDQAHGQRLLGMLDVIGQSGSTNLIYVSHRPDEIPACITNRLYIQAGRVSGPSPRPAVRKAGKDPTL